MTLAALLRSRMVSEGVGLEGNSFLLSKVVDEIFRVFHDEAQQFMGRLELNRPVNGCNRLLELAMEHLAVILPAFTYHSDEFYALKRRSHNIHHIAYDRNSNPIPSYQDSMNCTSRSSGSGKAYRWLIIGDS